MFLVAGINTFRAVAAEEVMIEPEAGMLFEDWHAVFLGTSGIDGGLVNDDVTFFQHFTHGFTGLNEGREVWSLMFVYRRGNGDDIAVTRTQIV